jgi:hypothetical protein
MPTLLPPSNAETMVEGGPKIDLHSERRVGPQILDAH